MVCEKLFNEFYIKIRFFSSINKKTYKTIDEILYAFNQLLMEGSYGIYSGRGIQNCCLFQIAD